MKKKYTILSVEDNKADFLLLEKALKKIKDLDLNIINVKNGKEAVEFVEKKGQFSEALTPDLIILDLYIPKISGLEVLKRLKTDEKYKMIPIVIYTSSISKEDIKKSYSTYANSYINKSYDIKELYKKIDKMGRYWLEIVTRPE